MKNMKRVVVTGMGAITPIGNSVEDFWNSVKAQKIGFAPISYFDASEYKAHLAAEVKDFNPKDFMDAKSARRMEKFSQYAVAAAIFEISIGTANGFTLFGPFVLITSVVFSII